MTFATHYLLIPSKCFNLLGAGGSCATDVAGFWFCGDTVALCLLTEMNDDANIMR